MTHLAPKTKVLRDGRWQEEDASILVPWDIISIKLGDIIPVDARLHEGDPLKIDQSALTGESLSVTKNPGDVYFGSTCKQGEIEAVVIATGVHTFFENNRDRINNLLVLLIGVIPMAMIFDKTGTLTLNKLSIDKSLVEAFLIGVVRDSVLLLVDRASRIENQDSIDAVMVGMLVDPKEARASIREVHFLSFNPVEKHITFTNFGPEGNWHRASKGAPE
ncbi:hypothetical protein SUGI_0466260 [Cryptomeria japonica]|nr:hypothetical protein SUGI_0466260 [Cryptomeria japonica]